MSVNPLSPLPAGASPSPDGRRRSPAAIGVVGLYDWLMAARSAADPFDRHVLACVLAAAGSDRPLTEVLGLDPRALERMLTAMFPGAGVLRTLVAIEATAGEDAVEEPDFRQLLLDGRCNGAEIEEWLACIVVRRSQQPEHLWRSLGLRNRQELWDMLHRHFPAVAARNVRGMRWKKFFYREMCHAEGIYVCKSPICDVCPDFSQCFSGED